MRLTRSEKNILCSVLNKMADYEREQFDKTELMYIPDAEYKAKVLFDKAINKQKKMRFRERVTIIIVAVLSLLLTSCTAYIFREEIAGLWISLFDDHMHVEGAGDSAITEIETVYLPTYIPEGHPLVREENCLTYVYRVWETSQTRVTYRQNLPITGSIVDFESADYEALELGGYTVHKLIKDEVIQLIWRQEDYVIRITTESLGYDEALKIFESIERIETSNGEE